MQACLKFFLPQLSFVADYIHMYWSLVPFLFYVKNFKGTTTYVEKELPTMMTFSEIVGAVIFEEQSPKEVKDFKCTSSIKTFHLSFQIATNRPDKRFTSNLAFLLQLKSCSSVSPHYAIKRT